MTITTKLPDPAPFPVPSVVTSLIGGEKVAPSGGYRIPVVYPATEEVVSELREADAAEVDLAVKAARKAFDHGPWPKMGVDERQKYLHRIADLILQNAEELAYLECLNTGLTMSGLTGMQIPRAAYNFRFFSEVISQTPGQVFTQNANYLTYVWREPVGVAGLIAPWNAPTALASMKVASAIAFGNTCVLKPSEVTPLALARFVDICHEAGLPPGVVNLVNGRGTETGQAIVKHDGVDVVSFTGGTTTGRKIAALAGEGLKKVTMELGGKSANIIFADADLEKALDGALAGIYSTNGQQCLAGSRILVQRKIAEEFMGRFVERAKKITVGDPLSRSTELGPLAFETHMNRVLSYAEIARKEGGTVLTGGQRHAGFNKGFFIEPTAVLAPSNNTRVAQEEIFGPFAAFIIFDTVDEAIEIANNNKFGLVGYCWTSNLNTAMRVSREVRAGVIWVNTTMMRELRAPFGGYKESGIGREGSMSCMELYTEEKTVTIPVGNIHIPQFGKR